MKRRTSKFWYANERKVIEKLGLKSTPRSGAGEILKEDGYNDDIICQLKSTESNQVSFKRLDVEKLLYHATVDRKIPIFVVQFIDGPMLIATVPAELENLSKYLKGQEFEKAKPIEIVKHKQKLITKIKGKGKLTVDEIIEESKIQNNQKQKPSTLSDVFEKRRERKWTKRN